MASNIVPGNIDGTYPNSGTRTTVHHRVSETTSLGSRHELHRGQGWR